MSVNEPIGVGWRMPLEVVDGDFALSSGRDRIAQSIWLILSTARGELVTRPDFGSALPDLVFSPMDATLIARVATATAEALGSWEPRIDVDDVAVTVDQRNRTRLLVSIDYRVRSTNSRFNLVYPFYAEQAE